MQQTSYGTLTITDTTDIARVQNWYLASSSSSGVKKTDSGWTTDVTNANATMTATKQYLWNYEQIQGEGANGSYITISTTDPVIIGRYGQNGGTGAAGRGITSIDEYYQITTNPTNPGSSGWQKNTLVAPTSAKPYLWNYQVINYTNPTSTQGTYNDARIIGVYGDKGDKGDAGRTYFLELSNNVVKKDANNTLTPTSVTIKSYYRDGTGAKTAYSGRMVIIGNKSDNTTTTVSTVNNSSTSLTINIAYVSYTINLYEAGGTTNLLATETLPILSDVENLQIGGRNLILCGNLNYSSTFSSWKNWGTVTAREIIEINKEKWMHITANGSNYGGYAQDGYGDNYSERTIYPNTNYIISFDAYASVDNTPMVACFHWRSSEGGANIGQSQKFVTLTTTRQRYSLDFKSGTSTTYNINRFSFMIGVYSSTSSGSQIYITNIKMEQGNIATEYTPAPEDINALSGLVSSLQTQLDGKIETWAQSTNPATWDSVDNDKHVGDLWYYTGNTTGNYINNTTYKYTKSGSNYSWQTYTQGTDLFTKINGKSTIFYGTTSGTYTGVQVGDYLVDSTDGSSYRWTGSAWDKVVDSVEIGGRNLVLNSGNTMEWPLYAPNSYQIAKVNLAEDFVRGETYTVTIWGGPITRSDKTSCYYSIYWGGGYFILGNTKLIKDGVYSKTFTVSETSPAQVDSPQTMLIYNTPGVGASGTTYSAPITKIKLEKGNRSTDWTPAPEDAEATIGEMQTSFITSSRDITALIERKTEDTNKTLEEQLALIQARLDEIKLQVSSTAKNRNFIASSGLNNSYTTEEPPTLLNYPTYTDFFDWPICNTNIYCSNSAICGTNRYSSHENNLAHCTSNDSYYIFKKDAADEYYWDELTLEEFQANSEKYSAISITEDQISIISALNSDITELLVSYEGVKITSGKLYCC